MTTHEIGMAVIALSFEARECREIKSKSEIQGHSGLELDTRVVELANYTEMLVCCALTPEPLTDSVVIINVRSLGGDNQSRRCKRLRTSHHTGDGCRCRRMQQPNYDSVICVSRYQASFVMFTRYCVGPLPTARKPDAARRYKLRGAVNE